MYTKSTPSGVNSILLYKGFSGSSMMWQIIHENKINMQLIRNLFVILYNVISITWLFQNNGFESGSLWWCAYIPGIGPFRSVVKNLLTEGVDAHHLRKSCIDMQAAAASPSPPPSSVKLADWRKASRLFSGKLESRTESFDPNTVCKIDRITPSTSVLHISAVSPSKTSMNAKTLSYHGLNCTSTEAVIPFYWVANHQLI